MTDILSYSLITVGDLKNFMGIDTPIYDEKLTMIVNAMTDYIESRCKRRFQSTLYTEYVNGDDSDHLMMKQYPITSITSVEENSNSDNSSNWATLAAEEYFNIGPDLEAGLIRKTSRTFKGTANYRVVYTAGYTTLPSDLKYACYMLCSEAFNRSRSAGVKSESLGDHSITFESISMENDNVEKVIQRYRKYTIA